MDVILGLFSTGGRANRAWYLWHILLDDLAMFTMIFGVVLLGALTGSPLLFLPAVAGTLHHLLIWFGGKKYLVHFKKHGLVVLGNMRWPEYLCGGLRIAQAVTDG